MKKFLKVSLLAIITSISTATMMSCNDDDKFDFPQVNLEDVPGNYSGNIIFNHEGLNTQAVIMHTMTKDSVKFKEFPLTQIVSSIEKDEVKADEILKKMGQVEYNFSYDSKIRQDFGGVELVLHPHVLELNIPTNNGDKKAIVNFTAAETGFYSTTQKALALRFEVTNIVYDDVKIEPFSTITYTLPYSTQRK